MAKKSKPKPPALPEKAPGLPKCTWCHSGMRDPADWARRMHAGCAEMKEMGEGRGEQ